jgi:hypothetical protein
MPYAAEPLYRLGSTARGVGIVMAGLSLITFAALLQHPSPQTRDRTMWVVAIFGLMPALSMIALSFPTQRGHLWAAIALVVICFFQLPSMLLFSGSCYTLLATGYFLARCMIALPEIRFQLRAARRTYRGHGFEPIPITRTADEAAASGIESNPARSPVIQPPPKSLKPSARRPSQ